MQSSIVVIEDTKSLAKAGKYTTVQRHEQSNFGHRLCFPEKGFELFAEDAGCFAAIVALELFRVSNRPH
jgi:hypothetical protein